MYKGLKQKCTWTICHAIAPALHLFPLPLTIPSKDVWFDKQPLLVAGCLWGPQSLRMPQKVVGSERLSHINLCTIDEAKLWYHDVYTIIRLASDFYSCVFHGFSECLQVSVQQALRAHPVRQAAQAKATTLVTLVISSASTWKKIKHMKMFVSAAHFAETCSCTGGGYWMWVGICLKAWFCLVFEET